MHGRTNLECMFCTLPAQPIYYYLILLYLFNSRVDRMQLKQQRVTETDIQGGPKKTGLFLNVNNFFCV